MAAGPEPFRRLLTLLREPGLPPVATIRKRRETFHLTFQEHELEIALDTAEGLGAFAEIEALASGEADLACRPAGRPGPGRHARFDGSRTRSYLRMVLENQAAAPG